MKLLMMLSICLSSAFADTYFHYLKGSITVNGEIAN